MHSENLKTGNPNLKMASAFTGEMCNGQLLLTTLRELNVPDNRVSADNALDLMASAIERIPAERNGASLFTAALSDKQWDAVTKVNRDLSREYALRSELLLKRLDVTVDSFTWSEEGAIKKNEVMKIYEDARNKINYNREVETSDLIAATTDLLVVDKTSSSAVRARTQNPLRNFLLKDTPGDRGGRTEEAVAPELEVPSWKKSRRGGHGGGGNRDYGSRGGGGRGRDDYRRINFEDQVKDQIRHADRRAHAYTEFGGPSVGPVTGHNYDDPSRRSKRGRHY
ncbi:hypothetical protein QR680_012660 [Steinernema hermaphroditum]|uniref:Protein FAM98A n=1 Tax=Steinernema hermaphroditum TaxID=289476 RepID=A0AA39I2R3_9BILA|nr:hypothetical protein QR680_012660 [Steinernema hermaphroditum]